VTRLRIREFTAADVAAVAALHARAHAQSSWISDAGCAAYIRELLLHNPWRDPELPSWVAEDGPRLVGFFGVLPRRMRFRERSVRVAVGCQLMVDPEQRRSFAALELMRRFFAGPQDLSVADGANDASRGCWEACGGLASPLHTLHWMRLLRPARGLLHLAGGRTLNLLGAPLAALADACLDFGAHLNPGLREEPLDAAGLAGAIDRHRGAFALRPDYHAADLEWLLAQARAKRRHGDLHGALLRDRGGRAAGWFLYYLNDAVSKVLSVGGGRDALPAVLEALFAHARSRGAAALEGRLEPHLAAALKGKRCLLQNRGIATLLHARDPALLVPFLRGDALFTRLEGEWWTRFNGEPVEQQAAKREQNSFPGTIVPAAKRKIALTPF
jgi:hypothetical protein